MVLSLAFIIGATLGFFIATKKGGNRLDKLHYGVVVGIAIMLLTLLIFIFAQRLGIF